MKKLKFYLNFILIVFASNIAFGQSELVKEILSSKTKKYCTKGNEKAFDLNLCIKYPQSWIEKEGNRPHILVKLRGTSKPEMVVVLIYVIKSDKELAESKKIFTIEGLKSLADESGMTYLSGNNDLKIDGLEASSYDVYYKTKQLDKAIELYSRNYVFLYKNYYIQIQCGITCDEDHTYNITNGKEYFESCLSLFELIVNSTTIVNQWE